VQATHNEQLLHEVTSAFLNAGAEVAALKRQLELCKTRAERAAADCSLEHQGMAQSMHQKVVNHTFNTFSGKYFSTSKVKQVLLCW
jgi:type II secretory pathway component PulL